MPTPDEMLSFGIFIDIRDSLKAMERFQREMLANMKAVAKGSEKMGKASEKASEKATKASEEQKKAVEDVADAYEGQEDAIANLYKNIEELKKLEAQASAEQKKHIREAIIGLEKTAKARIKASGGQRKTPRGGMFFGTVTPRQMFRKMRKDLKEAGNDLKAPLQSFLQKDAKGLVENTFKAGGIVFSKTIGRAISDGKLKAATRLGAIKLGGRGREWAAKGQLRGGGLVGTTQQLGGKALQGLGKSLSFLTKLGPILGVLSGAVVGLLKLFIDADAMVKEFNKGVLQSASTVGFLADAQGNLAASSFNMESALKGVRDAAFDAKFNLQWGTTKDDHIAVLNTLTQEGVALDTLYREAGRTEEGMKKLSQSLVATGVTYTRALGVPISEIAQFQAHMMVEMGSSVDTAEQSFANLARAAADSGMPANQFFQTVKSLSHDLSLWNLRMNESVNLLEKLGSVMSPNNARKFFQEIGQGFKQMGRQDLLKQTMFAGEAKVRKIVKEDVAAKQKELAKEIAEATGKAGDKEAVADLEKKIKTGGYNAAFAAIQGADRSKRGVLRDKASEIERQQIAMKHGTYGAAIASGDIQSLAGVLEISEAKLSRFGGDIIEQYGALPQGAAAEALGMSQEQVKQLVSLKMALKAQRQVMIDNGMDAEKVAKMSDRDVMDKLDAGVKDQIKEAGMSSEQVQKSIMDFSKEQTGLTTSILKQLEILVDFLMNQLYNFLMGIWDSISSLPIFGKSDTQRAFEKALMKSRDTRVQSAFAESGSDMYKFRGELMKGQFGKDLKEALSGNKSHVTEARIGKALSESGASGGDARSILEAAYKGQGKTADFNDLRKFQQVFEETGSLVQAFKSTDITDKNIRRDVFHQAAGFVDPTQLLGLAGSIGGGAAPAGAAPKRAEAKSQQREAQKTQEEAAEAQAETAAVNVEQAATLGDIQDSNVGLQKALDKNYRFFKSDLAKEFEEGTLQSLRTALYEYYLYSGIEDRSKVAAAIQKGGSLKAVLPKFASQVQGGQSDLEVAMDTAATEARASANAAGGIVTGVGGGLATVRAAAGEGLASVGVGERIVPAGGGAGPITVNVNGVGGRDLASLIEGKVIEGVREFKRREKFY